MNSVLSRKRFETYQIESVILSTNSIHFFKSRCSMPITSRGNSPIACLSLKSRRKRTNYEITEEKGKPLPFSRIVTWKKLLHENKNTNEKSCLGLECLLKILGNMSEQNKISDCVYKRIKFESK